MPVIQFSMPEADYVRLHGIAKVLGVSSTNLLGKAVLRAWLKHNGVLETTDQVMEEHDAT